VHREQLLTAIKAIYHEKLNDDLVGVILTGSAGCGLADKYSDVDYVIILKELSSNAIELVNIATSVFSKCVANIDIGLSMATWDMIARLEDGNYFELDPKITQAIIQCSLSDYWLTDGFLLPVIKEENTKQFNQNLLVFWLSKK
jgi:predicted nucleotidyltransferase